jgi:putative hydrolase of the HAD superfamily
MIKVIIFDLDGTLYRSTEISTKFAEAAYYAMSKLKNIPFADAKELIESKRAQLKDTYGEPVPYTLTLRSFGLSTERWHQENIAYFDPRDFLSKDEQLQHSLSELKKRYCLVILTNNNNVQTERILEALEIGDFFEEVFTYNTFKLLKPDPTFIKRAVQELNVKPEECCFVGDRYNVDLEPARRLNMHTYQVNGPVDIYKLADDMRCDGSV